MTVNEEIKRCPQCGNVMLYDKNQDMYNCNCGWWE